MKVAFAKPEIPASGTLVALAAEGRKLGKLASQLDKATKGAITRALEASRFKGGAEEFLTAEGIRPLLSGLLCYGPPLSNRQEVSIHYRR